MNIRVGCISRRQAVMGGFTPKASPPPPPTASKAEDDDDGDASSSDTDEMSS